MTGEWRNRIIAHAMVDPKNIAENPRNFRIHTNFQMQLLENILGRIGWIASVTINKTTGVLVDGHARVREAIRRGQKKIPVSYVRLTREEEAEALLLVDRITGLAEIDEFKQNDLMKELEQEFAENPIYRELLGDAKESIVSHKSNVKEAELEITPELHERHDYLVILFDNEFDWKRACELLNVGTVKNAQVGKTSAEGKRGTGRVVRARDFLRLVEEKGSRQ